MQGLTWVQQLNWYLQLLDARLAQSSLVVCVAVRMHARCWQVCSYTVQRVKTLADAFRLMQSCSALNPCCRAVDKAERSETYLQYP